MGKMELFAMPRSIRKSLESVTAMAVEEGFQSLVWTFLPSKVGMEILNFSVFEKEESASNQVLAEIEEVVERAHSQFKNE